MIFMFDKNKSNNEQEEVVRIRIPKGKEVLGILEQRLGGSRMRVRCLDGKTRLCRVPGRLKKGLWVREGDVFITKEVSLKTGVDLYLTSSSFAKSIGERLKRKFRGKITLSRSLYGYNREKSKEVYRLTVCFRLNE